MERGVRARWVAQVVLCYCITLVARGHGIVPAALLLAVMPESAVGTTVLTALGFALPAASLVPRRPVLYAGLAVGGMFCLGLSVQRSRSRNSRC